MMLLETSQASSWHSLLAAESNRQYPMIAKLFAVIPVESHYHADSLPKLLRKVIYICKIGFGVSQVETSFNNRMQKRHLSLQQCWLGNWFKTHFYGKKLFRKRIFS